MAHKIQSLRSCRNSRSARSYLRIRVAGRRYYSSTPRSNTPAFPNAIKRPSDLGDDAKDSSSSGTAEVEPGAMSRRLEEATEEVLLSGGRAGFRAIGDAGFSEELKEKLFNKVADAKFPPRYASAFAKASMPASAGDGTRAMAAAQPWSGEESAQDTVLRMLVDAKKPLRHDLRGKPQIPSPIVDVRLKRHTSINAGKRIADARDRAAKYAEMGKMDDKGLSQQEKDAMRKEFKERFQPGARIPKTISGLAALANERIEDAIARGQFKDIPRGKGIERDHRADNPFIDTTEHILNKMLKRQDIVPPWIEKQQELSKTANTFRTRLRNDWKRHAARMIASHGGTLEEQMNRAKEHARAEAIHNPRRRDVDEISVPANSSDDPARVESRRSACDYKPKQGGPDTGEISLDPAITPFRDPSWEMTENSYITLAIERLNSITRTYNLMAPDLAKKPYFTMQRELDTCFADVAPLLADAIRERVTRPPKPLLDMGGSSSVGTLERPGGQKPAQVDGSKAPKFGLREIWRDFWKPGPS